MTALWDPARFGCIERDSFQLQPSTRIATTSGDVPPRVSKAGDYGAPISATFNSYPTAAQFAAFEQWVQFDLAAGALPFQIDLWLWNKSQRVRARLQGMYKAQRITFDAWQVGGSFEIERQGVTAGAPALPPLRPSP